MADYIWNDIDGTVLAKVEDGQVFRATDNRHIGNLRGGDLYGLDGKLLGHVETLDGAVRGAIPEGFRALATGRDD